MTEKSQARTSAQGRQTDAATSAERIQSQLKALLGLLESGADLGSLGLCATLALQAIEVVIAASESSQKQALLKQVDEEKN